MSLDKLADVVLKDLGEILQSKSVIGEPIEVGCKIIIPITRVSFGFGIGGSGEDNEKNFGGGSAGGANIEPVSFLIIDEERGVKLIRATSRRELWEKILDLPQAEEIMERLRKFLDEKLGTSSHKNKKKNNHLSSKEEKRNN